MSYEVHPARRVAWKNGDCRYHGPKYRVALFSSISWRSLTMKHSSVRAASDRSVRLPGLNHDSNHHRSASRATLSEAERRLNARSIAERAHAPLHDEGAPAGAPSNVA